MKVLRTSVVVLLLVALFGTTAWAQARQISGRVTRSGSTQPVPDVRVSLINLGQATVARTSADGRYTIGAPAGEVLLTVRAIGYTRREITVPPGTTTLDIVLVQDFFRLSEVVVTGQATTIERRSATTAIAYVSGDEISRVAAPTFENALTGKVSGINLQSNSGAPGGGIQMQIRGKQHDPRRV